MDACEITSGSALRKRITGEENEEKLLLLVSILPPSISLLYIGGKTIT